MIKLTYQIICDICKKECAIEKYDCVNGTGNFPRPTMQHTFAFGYSTELCNDCAAPLMIAREKVISARRQFADALDAKLKEKNG